MEHLTEIRNVAKELSGTAAENGMPRDPLNDHVDVQQNGRAGTDSSGNPNNNRMQHLETELQRKDRELADTKSRLSHWKDETAQRLYRKLRTRMSAEFHK